PSPFAAAKGVVCGWWLDREGGTITIGRRVSRAVSRRAFLRLDTSADPIYKPNPATADLSWGARAMDAPTRLTDTLTDRRCRLLAVALIVGSALLRLLYLACNCPLDLSPDEAHYWDWSRHLDWS